MNNTISQFIPGQFPVFVQEQYPKFCEFLKAYYEYLEEPNNPIWNAQRILTEIALDSTSEASIQNFLDYIGAYFPDEYAFDKTHILKFIKEFYLSRGTPESFEFFFTLLYGSETGKQTAVDFPIKNVLHTSLGDWTERKSVKIKWIDFDISNLINKTITDVSAESAIIESAITYVLNGIKIIELYLQVSSITGAFIPGIGSIAEVGPVEILPVITSVNIDNNGSGYDSDDIVLIKTDYSGIELDLENRVSLIDTTTGTNTVESWDNNNDVLNSAEQLTVTNSPIQTRADLLENRVYNGRFTDGATGWTLTRATLQTGTTVTKIGKLLTFVKEDNTATNTHFIKPANNLLVDAKIGQGSPINFKDSILKFIVYSTNRNFKITKNFTSYDANNHDISGVFDTTLGEFVTSHPILGVTDTVTNNGDGSFTIELYIPGGSLISNIERFTILLCNGTSGIYTGNNTSGIYIGDISLRNFDTALYTDEVLDTDAILAKQNNKQSIRFYNNKFLDTGVSINNNGGSFGVFAITRQNGVGPQKIIHALPGNSTDRISISVDKTFNIRFASSNANYIQVNCNKQFLLYNQPCVISYIYNGGTNFNSIRLFFNGKEIPQSDCTFNSVGTYNPAAGAGANLLIGSEFDGIIDAVIYDQGYVISDARHLEIVNNIYRKFVSAQGLSSATGSGEYLNIGDIIDGEVYKINVIASGLNYSTPDEIEIISSSGTGFVGNIIIGGISNYPGFWKSNLNQVSQGNVRLQDNFFYQQFSYVISSPVPFNNYENRVLELMHPAGRKMFGRFLLVDELQAFSENSAEGIVQGKITSLDYDLVTIGIQGEAEIVANISEDNSPESLFVMDAEKYSFLASRVFYPNQEFETDDYFASGLNYGGEYSYDNTNSLGYIGGQSNTEAIEIFNTSLALQPDPVVYRFPFQKSKCKFWLTGASKVTQKINSVDFNGGLDDIKWQVEDASLFNFGDSDFSISLQFRPDSATNRALISLCSDEDPGGGVLSPIWGGSATSNAPAIWKSRCYGIGFNSSRQVYVVLFDDDDDADTDDINTYTHTSVLSLSAWHSVLVSYNSNTQQVLITVNGNTQTFSHTSGIRQPAISPPLVIGGTDAKDSTGKSQTFDGTIRNVGIWNRVLNHSTEASLLIDKIYKQVPTQQKHGNIFFSELGYIHGDEWIDEQSGFNSFIRPYKSDSSYSKDFVSNGTPTVSTQSRFGITEIYDQTFWNGSLNDKIVATGSSFEVYNSSFGSRENLLLASNNLARYTNDVFFSNHIYRHANGYVEIAYPDTSGLPISNTEFRVVPWSIIRGNYILSFEIENNINDTFGNIKGFSIQYGPTLVYLYKRGDQFYSQGATYEVLPGGNWIKITCTLPNVPEGGFYIKTGTTDSTTFYTSGFIPVPENYLKMRNFHFRRAELPDQTYIQSKQVPIIAGNQTPCIVFNSYTNGYDITSEKFNITNKAIFCVCRGGSSKIISGTDFEFEVGDSSNNSIFTVNMNGAPASVTLSNYGTSALKMFRAYHVGSDLSIKGWASDNVNSAEDTDIVAITAPSSGNQTYTLFSDNTAQFTMFEFIVLDEPDTEDIEATTLFLLKKYFNKDSDY